MMHSKRMPPPERLPIVDYLEFAVALDDAGTRLDSYIAARSDLSRSRVQRLLKQRLVSVNGQTAAASYRLKPSDLVAVEVPEEEPDELVAEDMPLDVVYQDADLVVINKPAGCPVHPAPGHVRGTLAGALLYRFKTLSSVQGRLRPGIVHRLDKDTSGLLLVARNDRAHRRLARQFKERTVRKEYLAIAHGQPRQPQGVISRPIGHSVHGIGEMAVNGLNAKEAITEYEVLAVAGAFSLLRCFPRTGRTHQIRVHLAHIGCPIVCDALYGRETVLRLRDVPGGVRARTSIPPADIVFRRHALHAASIAFRHPLNGLPFAFERQMPGDMSGLWQLLTEAAL